MMNNNSTKSGRKARKRFASKARASVNRFQSKPDAGNEIIHIFGELTKANNFDVPYLYIDFEFAFPESLDILPSSHSQQKRQPRVYKSKSNQMTDDDIVYNNNTHLKEDKNEDNSDGYMTHLITHCSAPFKYPADSHYNRDTSSWMSCCARRLHENTYNFCTPFEFHIQRSNSAHTVNTMDGKSPQSWSLFPFISASKIMFEVSSIDIWDTHRIEGYGMMDIPSQCGSYKHICVQCWKPIGSIKDELTRFFVGGGLRLKDKKRSLAVVCNDRYNHNYSNRMQWQSVSVGNIYMHLEIVKLVSLAHSTTTAKAQKASARAKAKQLLSKTQPLPKNFTAVAINALQKRKQKFSLSKKHSRRQHKKKTSRLQSLLKISNDETEFANQDESIKADVANVANVANVAKAAKVATMANVANMNDVIEEEFAAATNIDSQHDDNMIEPSNEKASPKMRRKKRSRKKGSKLLAQMQL